MLLYDIDAAAATLIRPLAPLLPRHAATPYAFFRRFRFFRRCRPYDTLLLLTIFSATCLFSCHCMPHTPFVTSHTESYYSAAIAGAYAIPFDFMPLLMLRCALSFRYAAAIDITLCC